MFCNIRVHNIDLCWSGVASECAVTYRKPSVRVLSPCGSQRLCRRSVWRCWLLRLLSYQLKFRPFLSYQLIMPDLVMCLVEQVEYHPKISEELSSDSNLFRDLTNVCLCLNTNLQFHSDKPMSGAGSLVDLDQQIILNTKY